MRERFTILVRKEGSGNKYKESQQPDAAGPNKAGQQTLNAMNKYPAILLLGPTGSGKTPLGIHLEKHGFSGRRCFHFDFGEQLRSIGDHGITPMHCSEDDIAYIKKVLKQGALLENETFYIAKNILLSFIDEKNITHEDCIVLNGLPRHVDQAKDIDSLVAVKLVIFLECSSDVVKDRISRNAGGDRTDREDDSSAEIESKLDLFYKRTLPLIDYYTNKKIDIKRIDATVDTTPIKIIQELFHD